MTHIHSANDGSNHSRISRRTFLGMAGAALVATQVPATAMAAKDPIYTGLLGNTAAGGYDVVAYFTEGKPVEGSKDFSLEHEGAKWRFSSQANLDLFKSDPEKYAPKYGGYCAYAASQGYTAKGDPEAWTVHEDRLYLNYSLAVRDRWSADKVNYIAQADANWPKILE